MEAVQTLADLLRTPQELAATRRGPLRWRMPHLAILGFHPRDREQLILATRGAYSMPMQRLVDIRTGLIRDFGDDWPAPPGGPQVYDSFRLKVVGERPPTPRPSTTWHNEDLGPVQRELATKFPRRIVELLDWSDSRRRVLVSVPGGSDPGRVFLYQRAEDLVVELFRHAPWLPAAQLHPTRWFDCPAPDGAPSGGYLTAPRQTRARPPPLLVLFPFEPTGGALAAFDPGAKIFAELGFAVARLHHRAPNDLRAEGLTAWRAVLDRLAVEFVARDATFAATSPTTRANAFRQLGERRQQRLHPATASSSPAEEVE